jgi:hypothetical protein
MQRITVSFPDEVYEGLRRLAFDGHVSVSQVVRQIAEDALGEGVAVAHRGGGAASAAAAPPEPPLEEGEKSREPVAPKPSPKAEQTPDPRVGEGPKAGRRLAQVISGEPGRRSGQTASKAFVDRSDNWSIVCPRRKDHLEGTTCPHCKGSHA